MLLFYECLKFSGQYQIPQVLVCYKHPVLVIDNLFRPSPEVLEGEFMGINCKLRIKRAAAEVDKLITGACQYDSEEVNLRASAIFHRYPLLPEIRLGVFPVGGLRQLFIITPYPGLGFFPDTVLPAYPVYKIEYGLVTYPRKIGVTLPEPVMHTGSRYVRVFFQCTPYILLVLSQLEFILPVGVLLSEKLFPACPQISPHSAPVHAQIFSDLCLVQSFRLKFSYLVPHIQFVF